MILDFFGRTAEKKRVEGSVQRTSSVCLDPVQSTGICAYS